jgi:hypothetical protein
VGTRCFVASCRHVLAGALTLTWTATALAYNEDTHVKITEWSYNVLRAVTAEDATQTPLEGTIPLSTPPATCAVDPCRSEYIAFVQRIPEALARLNLLPAGTICEGADDRTSLGDVAVGLSNPGSFGGTDACPRVPTSSSVPQGVFNDQVVLDVKGRFGGTTLGWHSARIDKRINDWEIVFDPQAFSATVAGFTLSGFGAAPYEEWLTGAISDVDQAVRDVGHSLLFAFVLALAAPFLPFIGDDARNQVVSYAEGFADFATNLDRHLFSHFPLEGVLDLESATVGLGHHINVQEPGPDGIPSNEYDDRQGAFYDEAFWVTDEGGLCQDSLDHFLIDRMALGAAIDGSASYGVKNYQIFSSFDGHAVSRKRLSGTRTDSGSEADAYWQQHTLNSVPFTPLDNLAEHFWRQWEGEPCRVADTLGGPLHALQDATVPMHAIGSTGHGHRPYEDAVSGRSPLSGRWDTLRNVSSANLRPAQYEQIRRILHRALEWNEMIEDHRTARATMDVPVRDLVTAIAKKAEQYTRHDVPKVSCRTGACSRRAVCVETADCSCAVSCKKTNPCCPVERQVFCDPSACTGFDQSLQGTCSLGGGTTTPPTAPRCTGREIVALALSESQFQDVEYPALLGPGLSDFYQSEDKKRETTAFYEPYLEEQRNLVETAVAASLAFLVALSDQIDSSELAGCTDGCTAPCTSNAQCGNSEYCLVDCCAPIIR